MTTASLRTVTKSDPLRRLVEVASDLQPTAHPTDVTMILAVAARTVSTTTVGVLRPFQAPTTMSSTTTVFSVRTHSVATISAGTRALDSLTVSPTTTVDPGRHLPLTS